MSTDIREVPGVGRCLFAAAAILKGETFACEAPCFVSRPEDQPAILALLEHLHAEEAFGFGHVKSYLAAVQCYLSGSPAACGIVLERWMPGADGRLKHEEVERVVAALEQELLLPEVQLLPQGRDRERLTPMLLHKFVTGWEYNGFSGEDGSLLMYDQISTASHSCDPNCDQVVLYGLFRPSPKQGSVDTGSGQQASSVLKKGDVFEQKYNGLAFRANRDLKQGDEITFSYCLSREELAQDFRFRRRMLNHRGWNFVCGCPRCTQEGQAFVREGREAAAEEPCEEGGDMSSLFDGI